MIIYKLVYFCKLFPILVVVKDELDLVLQHPDLCNRILPILFYGNKSDLEDSLSNVKIAAGNRMTLCSICNAEMYSLYSFRFGEHQGKTMAYLFQQRRFRRGFG